MTLEKPPTGPIVEFIARQPGMAARLLAEHVDDGTGHCAGCSWQERPRPVVPCPLHGFAEQASKR